MDLNLNEVPGESSQNQPAVSALIDRFNEVIFKGKHPPFSWLPSYAFSLLVAYYHAAMNQSEKVPGFY